MMVTKTTTMMMTAMTTTSTTTTTTRTTPAGRKYDKHWHAHQMLLEYWFKYVAEKSDQDLKDLLEQGAQEIYDCKTPREVMLRKR